MYRLAFIFLFLSSSIFAQEIQHLQFTSQQLNESRELDIYLPEGYADSVSAFPLIVTLDGDYLFSALSGQVGFHAKWDKLPAAVVVGIRQGIKRRSDCDYDAATGNPENKGLAFRDFITEELLPYLDSAYHLADYRVLVGHSFTGNYLQYLMALPSQPFQAYISLSPYYANGSLARIRNTLTDENKNLRYYHATAKDDLKLHQKCVRKLDRSMPKEIQRSERYQVNTGATGTHVTLIPDVLPAALKFVFKDFGALQFDDYREWKRKAEPVTALRTRVALQSQYRRAKQEVRLDDLFFVSSLLTKRDRKQLLELAEWTLDAFPEATYGYYMLGAYHELNRDYEKALTNYRIGYSKLEPEVSNKADFYEDIARMEKRLGKN